MNLVTGATGHIGSALVRELLKRGERVRALVRSDATPEALANLEVEIVRGDILDPDSLLQAVQGVEVVYHLAARISLTAGPDPETERVNLQGTRNVLDAVRRSPVRRLVYASSIYALRKPPDSIPIDESQPFEVSQAQGPYDATKALASLEVQYAIRQGLNAVLVCPTAVAGPYDYHDSEAGRAVRLYMRSGLKFIVDGAYDFVDVRDVAEGFILAAQKGRRGETYILGGDRLTVLEVARLIWEASGGWHPYIKIPTSLAYAIARLMPAYSALTGARPLFTRYSLDAICSNSSISHEKAERELGFHPRPARQSIIDTVCWWKNRQSPQACLEQPAENPA